MLELTPGFLGVVCALLVAAMTSAFLCCFRRANSLDNKVSVQSVKEKSPSPDPEDRNGLTSADSIDTAKDKTETQDWGVERASEVLQTYRRPQAPRKKERHSRAPRALHRSTERLVDVFGDVIEKDEDEQLKVDNVDGGVKVNSDRSKLENGAISQIIEMRENVEDKCVIMRDNSGRDSTKRETRSSMLLDIEKTLANMHMLDQNTQGNDPKEKPAPSPSVTTISESENPDTTITTTDVCEPSSPEHQEQDSSTSVEAGVPESLKTPDKQNLVEHGLSTKDGASSEKEHPITDLKDNDRDSDCTKSIIEAANTDTCDRDNKDGQQPSKDMLDPKDTSKVVTENGTSKSTVVEQSCDIQQQADIDITKELEGSETKETNTKNIMSLSATKSSSICNNQVVSLRNDNISKTSASDVTSESEIGKPKKIPPPVSPKPSPKFRAAVEAKRISESLSDTKSINNEDQDADNNSAVALKDDSNLENISDEKDEIDDPKRISIVETSVPTSPSRKDCESGDSANSTIGQTKIGTATPLITKPVSGIPLSKSMTPTTSATKPETASVLSETDSVGIEDLCSGEVVLVSRPPSAHKEHVQSSEAVNIKREMTDSMMAQDTSLEIETPSSTGDTPTKEIILSNNEDAPLSPTIPKSKIPTSPIMAEKLAKKGKPESPEEKDNRGRQRRESDESKAKITSKIPVRGGSKNRASPPKTTQDEEKKDSPSTNL